jgi:hypothetical protein
MKEAAIPTAAHTATRKAVELASLGVQLYAELFRSALQLLPARR